MESKAINDQLIAEAAITKSQQELSLIYNHTHDFMGLFKYDGEGNFIIESVNQAYIDHLTGKGILQKGQSLEGINLAFFLKTYLHVAEEGIKERFSYLHTVRLSKRKINYESTIFNAKKGDETIYDITLNPIIEKNADLCNRIIFVTHDITNQKETASELIASEAHSKTLFDHSPIIIWEEDSSAVKKYFDSLTKAEITNLDAFFDQHPEELKRLAALINIKNVNQKSVDFYETGNKEKHIRELSFYFVEESWKVLKAEFVALAQGATTFESEIPIVKANGEIVHHLLKVSIPPEYKKTWKSVIVSFVDITDLKKNQLLIEQSKIEINKQLQHKQLILDTMLDGYLLTDSKADIVDTNPAYCKMIGYTREELLSMNMSQISKQLSQPEIDQKRLEAIKSGSAHFEDIQTRKDGSLINIDVKANAMEVGGMPMFAAFLRDITAEKAAREELKASEKRMSTIYNSSQDLIGLIRFNKEGQCYEVESINQPSVEYLTKIKILNSLEEVQGKNVRIFFGKLYGIAEPIIDERIKMIEQVFLHKKSIKYQNAVPHPVKNIFFHFETVLSPVIDPNGVCTHVLLASRDITQSEMAKNKLISSEKHLKSIFNGSTDQMAILDLQPNGDLIIEQTNKAFNIAWNKANYGIDLAPVYGRTLAYFLVDIIGFSEEKAAEYLKRARLVTKKKKVVNFEGNYQLMNKKKYFLDFTISPILNEDDLCTKLILVIRDTTLKHRAKEELIFKILETEDRERSRFAKELHDSLGQNLTAASLTFNQVKKSAHELSPDTRKRFETGIKFLKEAIDESRNIAHNLMPQAISDFGYVLAVESLLEDLSQSSNIEFTFYNNLHDERLSSDHELSLYRITQEAIHNILKHSEATKVTIQLIKHPESIILSIEDDGKGFDAKAPNSTSFGLDSMKARASALSGVIDIDGFPGKGVSITLEIPVFAAPLPHRQNT